MTDAAIIYRTHVEAIENLPEAEQLKAYKAIIAYCMEDEMPTDMIGLYTVQMAKPLLDKWKAKREAGAKGGSKRKQTEATESKPKQTEATEKETQPKVKVKVKVKEKDIKELMSGKPDPAPKKKTDLMPAVSEIIAYLNDRAGTKYRVYSRATQELIKGRLDERYTVEDFKRVIDNMAAAWKGDERMEQYLRPETLFKRSHFESYLNTKPKPKATAAGQFARFPQRNDAEHDDIVKRIIAMQ